VLRYFVAVAERLSFRGAADALYVSQPSLSRQIRALELSLQGPLFERTTREVRLTPAGEALLPHARDLLARWQRARRETLSQAAAQRQAVRLGFEATGAGKLGSRARALFEQRHAASIEPRRFDWGGEVPALRNGIVDVAFVWLPADLTGLEHRLIATEPRMIALRRDHPLGAREHTRLRDIAHIPLVRTSKAPEFWVDWWAVNPRPDGTRATWGPDNDNPEEQLDHVAAGVAGAIVPQSMSSFYGRPDLIYLPITDIDPLQIALGWTPDPPPLVAAFIDTVLELAEPAHTGDAAVTPR
jgi:DNA-binding transcriptional LysR family regulator